MYTGMRRRVYVCPQVIKHNYSYPLTPYSSVPSVLSWSLQRQSCSPICSPECGTMRGFTVQHIIPSPL